MAGRMDQYRTAEGLPCRLYSDAVCMKVMGFDPMAVRGTPPFETADSTLELAERVGIGTRDLSRVEVVGLPLGEPAFDFAALRRQRRLVAAPGGRG